jgi:hypothetical protein
MRKDWPVKTLTENTICHCARKATNDIIHAEGVRVAVTSSAPQGRKLHDLGAEISVLGERDQFQSGGAGRIALHLPTGKNGVARRQNAVHLAVVLGHF